MAKSKLTAAELEEAVKLYTESKKKKLKEADEDGDKKDVDVVKNLKKADDKDDDSDDEGDEDDETDKEKEKVDEASDEDGEGGDSGSGESPFGSVDGKLKQGVSEAKAKKRVLTQSYREEEQPAVETLGSPFGDDKGKLKQGVEEATNSIFAGEDLSEGFKTKAGTIIEAVVTSLVKENTKEIEKIAQKNLSEAIEEIEEELMEKADSYVGYVVKEWLEENKLQAESSLKLEILEGFFDGLRQLFNEHNIAVPSENLDLLEAKNAEVASLTKKVNSLTEKLIVADKNILESKKTEVIAKLSEGLTVTQVEKLKTLTEGLEAKSIESFSEKAAVIKESFFKDPSKTVIKKEDGSQVVVTEGVDPSVQKILEHMKTFG